MAKKDQTLQRIVSLLKREFKPSRLYLFGSRASKTAGPDSDYDFVMVIPGYRGDRMKTWERCRKLIKKECIARADVFTYSESEFQRERDEFSSMPETAVNTGREIDLGPLYWRACTYHAQQAVEKAIKAYLTHHQVRFPKTHDIEDLVVLVANVDPKLAKRISSGERLTKYAIEYRYPSAAKNAMTRNKVRSAAMLAEKIYELITTDLRGR